MRSKRVQEYTARWCIFTMDRFSIAHSTVNLYSSRHVIVRAFGRSINGLMECMNARLA